MNVRETWSLVTGSVRAWSDDYAPSMGAALSYYTLFSVAPLLLIVIAVAGLIFGADAARGEIFEQLRGLMGDEGAAAIERLLQHAGRPTEGLVATAIGVGVLLFGATTVFHELQNDLDRIWRVPKSEQPGGLFHMVRTRLLSFGMVLGIAFLLMVSLVISAALAALGKWWAPAFAGWTSLAFLVDSTFTFVLLTVVFAMIYKLMPSARIGWRDVWIGAAVTSALFAAGKFLIGLYLGRSSVGSAFGAAGSLVVVMVWVYYSAQIFLLGAEFTRVYAHTHGSRRPIPTAPASAAAPPFQRAGKDGFARAAGTFGVATVLGAVAALLARARKGRPAASR